MPPPAALNVLAHDLLEAINFVLDRILRRNADPATNAVLSRSGRVLSHFRASRKSRLWDAPS